MAWESAVPLGDLCQGNVQMTNPPQKLMSPIFFVDALAMPSEPKKDITVEDYLVAGKGDRATDVLQPGDAVELGEDGFDLPCILLALGV